MRKLSLVLAFACLVSSANAEPFFPTTIGTTWQFTVRGAPGKGSEVLILLVQISGSEQVDGRQLLRLDTLADEALVKSEWVSVNDAGVFCHRQSWANGRTHTFEPPKLLLPAPLSVGTTWETDDLRSVDAVFRRFEVAAEEELVLEAGKFRAARIESEESWPVSTRIERWFVPGVGFVREVETTRGPGGKLLGRVATVLTKFSSSGGTATGSRPSVEVSFATPSPTPPKAAIEFELSATRDGDAATEFRSDTQNIFVRWNGHDLPVGADVRIAWIAEDVGDVAPPNFVVDQVVRTITTAKFGARFTLSRPKDGWAPGKYRAELYLRDDLIATVPVTIDERPPASSP